MPGTVRKGLNRSNMGQNGRKWSKMVENMSYTFLYKKSNKNRIPHKKIRRKRLAR